MCTCTHTHKGSQTYLHVNVSVVLLDNHVSPTTAMGQPSYHPFTQIARSHSLWFLPLCPPCHLSLDTKASATRIASPLQPPGPVQLGHLHHLLPKNYPILLLADLPHSGLPTIIHRQPADPLGSPCHPDAPLLVLPASNFLLQTNHPSHYRASPLCIPYTNQSPGEAALPTPSSFSVSLFGHWQDRLLGTWALRNQFLIPIKRPMKNKGQATGSWLESVVAGGPSESARSAPPPSRAIPFPKP